MYVQSQPGLVPRQFFRSTRAAALPFPLNAPHRTFSYMARNVIYHLFRSLKLRRDEIVLMPDYHSGVEVWAVRAAGAAVRFYPVKRNLEPDLEALERLCQSCQARVLYAVHYLGWPQPLEELMSLCRKHGMILLEDCALSLLSETGGQPLGTSGDYAVFCLYKTLPVPHGGLLVQNARVVEDLARLELEPCSAASVAGRCAELVFERVRGRSDLPGRALLGLKRGAGRALSAVGVRRLPVGDITPDFSSVGFDIPSMNIGMSPVCHRLMRGLDYEAIRRRRRENFVLMRERLAGQVPVLRDDLKEGVCPMFFPLLVPDKRAAARALLERGVGAVEFWNYGYPEAEGRSSQGSRFLREHLLELPIHQDITPEQVEYTVDQVLSLKAVVSGAFEKNQSPNGRRWASH
jgi:dTDP-4-amino-4,6-dideoxygalactose transaminase